MWASQSAIDLHVPVPNIDIAVGMRSLSAFEEDAGRRRAARCWAARAPRPRAVGRQAVSRETRARGALRRHDDDLRAGLRAAAAARRPRATTSALRDVASVWRGGLHHQVGSAARVSWPSSSGSPLWRTCFSTGELAEAVAARRAALASAVEGAMDAGIPVPGLVKALAYLDAYRAEWLPFNLIQAQRDYFGAHSTGAPTEKVSFTPTGIRPKRGDERPPRADGLGWQTGAVYPGAEALAVAAAWLVRRARPGGRWSGREVHVSRWPADRRPSSIYRLLASPPFADVPWESSHVFWGDERCVDAGDPRSNERMAREALLDHVRCRRRRCTP